MRLALAAAGLLLALGTLTRGDEPNSLDRLRSMPPERRKALAKNLAAFDSLPRAQREAIHDLDRLIAEAEPTDRARYYAVLRRYHLWLATLPEDQRKKLENTPPDQRLPLVVQYLKTQPTVPPDDTTWTQFSALSPKRLLMEAFHIEVWLALSPEEKKQFPKSDSTKDRVERLNRLAREKQLGRKFLALQQDIRAALHSYLAADPDLPDQIKQEVRDYLKEHPKALAKDQTKKGQLVARLSEAAFWKSFDPAPVAPNQLARFADALPSWLRAPLDPLPPEAARARLKVLYRLIYPRGTEMPVLASEPKEKPAPTPKPTSRPATGKPSF